MKKLVLMSVFFLFILTGCSTRFHKNEDYDILLTELFAIFTSEKLESLDTDDRKNYEISAALWWCMDTVDAMLPLTSCYVDFLVEYDAYHINEEDPPRRAGFIRVAKMKHGEEIITDNHNLVLSNVYGTTRRANFNAFQEIHEAHKSMNLATELYEGAPLNRRLP